MRIYDLWREGPPELPKEKRAKVSAVVEEVKKGLETPQIVSTKSIIEKNLFDPERGATKTKEAEASSIAIQRIRSMVLLGTAILGNDRYAILQQPADSRPAAQKTHTGQPGLLRLKLGDTVEGFKLSEIQEKKVVFTKGASRVEVLLDFSRKVEDGKPSVPSPTAPRPAVTPRIPRPQAGAGPTAPVRP